MSKKMPTVPSTIRFGQRNGLVLDAKNMNIVPPHRTLPYEVDTSTTLDGCWRYLPSLKEGTSSVVFRVLSTRELRRISLLRTRLNKGERKAGDSRGGPQHIMESDFA
jgi:hypothetical protein